MGDNGVRFTPMRHPAAARMRAEADLVVEGEPGGSIYRLIHRTDLGREWCDEKIASDAQVFGNAIIVEHRYIGFIVEGARADGLRVFIGHYHTGSE
jgi:hypothetical protein